jgi:uncharacterized iron-regulated membrane protein
MFRFTKTLAAALLVIAAISVPTASARPIDLVPPTARDTNAVVVQPENAPRELSPLQRGSGASAVRTIAVSSNDFDWGDAAIGAGAMLTLLGLASGTLVIARRRAVATS